MRVSRRSLLRASMATAVAPFLPACGRGREPVRILVIGAGIAGLYAARLLEQQGLKPVVIEASERIGGRLLTLDHVPGRPEAGGQSLDAMYARALALISELGLEVYPRQAYLPGRAIFVNGELVHSARWAQAQSNRLAGDEREVLPHQLANYYLDQGNPLRNLVDWLDPRFGDCDTRTLADELRVAGASDEAMRLMDILYDGRGLANMSALFAYRKRMVARFGRGEWYRIRGGSQRLPESIANGLANEVRLGQQVVGIRAEADGVDVDCRDGTRYHADFVLSSIPFSVLRYIAMQPEPPAPQMAMIRSLPYNHITQIKLGFRSRFWEKDELPAAMISDSAFEKLAATPGEDRELHVLNCWIDGQRAAELDEYTDEQIGARVLTDIESARPAAAGQLEVLDVTAWGKNPYSRGCYHFWAPGQVRLYGESATRPWGRGHWIGEHVATLQQGIEGAMESAEREVLAVLRRLA
jgi:monoamine oxidase